MDEKSLWTIITAIVVTALVVGGVVYFVQKSAVNSLRQDINDLKIQMQDDSKNDLTQENDADSNNEVVNTPSDTDSNPNAHTADNFLEYPDNNIAEFSVDKNGKTLAVGDWESESTLLKALGEPISEEFSALGYGSDTYEGTFLKNTSYEGLNLVSYSPKNNGETYWVTSITISSPTFRTKGGITVGDSFNDLKKVYPDIKIINDRGIDMADYNYNIDTATCNNNCTYGMDCDTDTKNRIIDFKVINGIITKFTIEKGLE